jgi:oligoribonuclease (3'-5' exoribonuclease)
MSERPGNADRFYVWFDTEYSDLELETAWLLQVAALITDSSLKRVLPPEQDVRLTIRLPDAAALSPWVEQNLPDLVQACRSPAAVSIDEADMRLAGYVDAAVGLPTPRENQRPVLAGYVDAAVGLPTPRENQRPVLAGNSLHADWWLARRFLPRFLGRLHYRHLDVTALKLQWMRLHPGMEFEKEDPEIIRRYFPQAALPESGSRHDACYDVHASIAELAFYRRFLFSE